MAKPLANKPKESFWREPEAVPRKMSGRKRQD
jgi:hypothetical protein